MCVGSLFSNICYVPDTMIIVAKKVDMLPKLMSYLNLERQIKKQKVKLEKLASSKRNKRGNDMFQGYTHQRLLALIPFYCSSMFFEIYF